MASGCLQSNGLLLLRQAASERYFRPLLLALTSPSALKIPMAKSKKTTEDSAPSLFTPPATLPLAAALRPDNRQEFFGHQEIFKRYPFLNQENFPHIILWGPPGTGKTTLAHILAKQSHKELFPFSAVLGGTQELKKLMNSVIELREKLGKSSIIFIDEIHRFNKAQQDALLPYVEEGLFTLIGATTENPRRSVNPALLSRVSSIALKALTIDDIVAILSRANTKLDLGVSPEILNLIASYANCDARIGLNLLEVLQNNFSAEERKTLTKEQVTPLILENSRSFDREGDRHYNVISAFIKSMRGSDPDATLLYLAIMLDGGEDPAFIARRMAIFASEDVGNADPSALPLATAALTSVVNIGMPEARIILAQAATYLASTVKSNSVIQGIDRAMKFVEEHPTIDTPNHLKNYPPPGTPPYKYPHFFPGHFVEQAYAVEELPPFYRPGELGREKNLKERLQTLWPQRNWQKH